MSTRQLGLQRLRALLDALEAMDEAAFAAFLTPGAAAAAKPPPQPRLPAPAALPPDALIERLQAAASRDAARALVGTLKKDALVALARALREPSGSRDTVAQLRDRIVAATAGARLDAEAIHQR